jgi:hypothetical protein
MSGAPRELVVVILAKGEWNMSPNAGKHCYKKLEMTDNDGARSAQPPKHFHRPRYLLDGSQLLVLNFALS